VRAGLENTPLPSPPPARPWGSARGWPSRPVAAIAARLSISLAECEKARVRLPFRQSQRRLRRISREAPNNFRARVQPRYVKPGACQIDARLAQCKAPKSADCPEFSRVPIARPPLGPSRPPDPEEKSYEHGSDLIGRLESRERFGARHTPGILSCRWKRE
jgi:hypothetical protein